MQIAAYGTRNTERDVVSTFEKQLGCEKMSRNEVIVMKNNHKFDEASEIRSFTTNS